jgi:hypothetical protein
MLIRQNFSVAKGNDIIVDLDIGPDVASLIGTNITWRAYEQMFGIPFGDPVIVKDLDNGLQISDPDLQLVLITLDRVDTVDLVLGNYWHEVSIDDTSDKHTTVTEGIMTLVRAENPVLV